MRGDPYTYPDTDVLRNKLNLRDEAALALADATYTTARLRELMLEPLHGAFNLAHLQAIHRYVFQNLYTWAGELRTVDIRKEDSFFFARPQFIW